MHNYLALILALSVPASAQLHRGQAGSTISALHNHWAIPTDGGPVYAWDMHNLSTTDCRTAGVPVPNNGTFTGSLTSDMQCTGTSNPTISSTGLTFTATSGYGELTQNIDNGSGFTLITVFKPNGLPGQQFCGIENNNYPTANTYQYWNGMSTRATGSIDLLYDNAGTLQIYSSTGTPVSTSAWQMVTAEYVSANAATAVLWYNKAIIAASWSTGTGTAALPAVQISTCIGNGKVGANSCLGTIGYQIVYSKKVSAMVPGFVYNAMTRAMMFRQVAMP